MTYAMKVMNNMMIRIVVLSALSGVAVAGVGAAADSLKTGDVAPDFSLPAAGGSTYKLSQFKGKIVVLEWFNKDCPYVHKFYDSKTMQKLQKDATAKGVVWLTIASSAEGKEGHLTAAEAAAVVKEKAIASTAFLLDSKSKVGWLFKAKTTPHMFVVDKDGRIAYQGALDDRPSAQPKTLDGAQNYVLAALTSLEKGEAVKTPATTPYGCSVKY